MPKVRNKSGQPLFIPALNLEVDVDEVFDVPADLMPGFASTNWETEDTKKAAPPTTK